MGKKYDIIIIIFKYSQKDMIRLGQSSRFFIVSSAVDDSRDDINNDDDQTFIASTTVKRKPAKKEESFEVSWGFREDAIEDNEEEEEGDEGHMGINTTTAGQDDDEEAYYHRDPKKALRTWCDVRGQSMNFTFQEEGRAHERVYTATIEFDIEGKGLISASGRGSKKKEAEKDASLKACIQLDRRVFFFVLLFSVKCKFINL